MSNRAENYHNLCKRFRPYVADALSYPKIEKKTLEDIKTQIDAIYEYLTPQEGVKYNAETEAEVINLFKINISNIFEQPGKEELRAVQLDFATSRIASSWSETLRRVSTESGNNPILLDDNLLPYNLEERCQTVLEQGVSQIGISMKVYQGMMREFVKHELKGKIDLPYGYITQTETGVAYLPESK